MSQGATEQNESMEDILHSIRRIIANDPEADAATHESEDVLELTEVVSEGDAAPKAEAAPAPEPEQAAAPEPEPEPVVEAAPPPPPPPPPAAEAPPPPPPPPAPEPQPEPEPMPESTPAAAADNSEALLTEKASQASAEALRNLVDSIPKPQVDTMTFRSGATLEALVVESIKPMLAEWLNKNLPTLVQSIVEKEIRKLLPKE